MAKYIAFHQLEEIKTYIYMHHPWFLEFVGAPESALLLTWTLGHWVHTMNREVSVAAALQLKHDAGLMTSNLQVLGQFVTSLTACLPR